MTKLKLHFNGPNWKAASRDIRVNPVFGQFVTKKSKNKRFLWIDFIFEEKYNVLKPLLFNTLKTMEYAFEEVT